MYSNENTWNDYPECLSIINKRLFSKDIDYKQFLINQKYNFERALILNCGVEIELYDCGIIKSATCVDSNNELIQECEKNKEERKLEYICHDINTINFENDTFDVVINYNGHHLRYIELVWNNINKWLKKDGFFIQNNYIGPQRNQYTSPQWDAMNELNNTLDIKKQLAYPTPTESIHSDKIVALTYSLFNVIYHKKSGGALAYELLTNNNELFNTPIEERKKIVQHILMKDEKYMETTGTSFFHFMISHKNDKKNTKCLEQMSIRERLADYTQGHYSYNSCSIGDIINSFDNSIFVHGFSLSEYSGRWSQGDTSIIRFKIEDPKPTEIYLVVHSLQNYNQEIIIELNQTSINKKIVNKETLLKIPIVLNSNYPNEVVLILKYHNVKTPKELNINEDQRKLALFFKTMYLL